MRPCADLVPGGLSDLSIILWFLQVPAALILLAHYCILLARLDSHWYMSGYSKNLFSRIYNQLDQEWRQLLYWPLEEIGLLV